MYILVLAWMTTSYRVITRDTSASNKLYGVSNSLSRCTYKIEVRAYQWSLPEGSNLRHDHFLGKPMGGGMLIMANLTLFRPALGTIHQHLSQNGSVSLRSFQERPGGAEAWSISRRKHKPKLHQRSAAHTETGIVRATPPAPRHRRGQGPDTIEGGSLAALLLAGTRLVPWPYTADST